MFLTPRGQQKRETNSKRTKTYCPTFDCLESRILLAWEPLGPLPQTGWPVPNSIFAMDVAGRVTSLAYSSKFDGKNDEIIMGTAGGGIWIIRDGQKPYNWRPITETFDDVNGNAITNHTLIAGIKAIGAVTVDPNDPKIIYAGTGEANYSLDSRFGVGILKSVDAGSTWTLATGLTVGAFQFYGHSVSSIFVDPTNSQHIYAAFVPAPDGGYGAAAYRDVDGVYESHNGGKDWRKIWSGDAHSPVIVTDMSFTIVDGKINIIAAVSNPSPGVQALGENYHNGNGKGIWRGTFVLNAGVRDWTFTQVRQEAASRRIDLTTNEGQGKGPIIYAAIVAQDASVSGVLRSGNNGGAWASAAPANAQLAALGKVGWYAVAIQMDKKDPNVVYLGSQGGYDADLKSGGVAAVHRSYKGGAVLRTDNAGKTWSAIDAPPNLGWDIGAGNNLVPHPDHHAFLVVSDARGQRVYNGTDGGVLRYNVKKEEWRNWNEVTDGVGLNTNLVNAVGVQSGRIANVANTTIWAGSHDVGLSSRQGTSEAKPWKSASAKPGGVFPIFKTGRQVAGDAGMVRVNPAGTVTYMVTNSAVDPANNAISRLVFWGWDSDVTQDWALRSHGAPTSGRITDDGTFPFYPVFAISPTEHNDVVLDGQKRRRYWVAVGSEYVWQREAVANPKDANNWTFRWRLLTDDGMGGLQRLNNPGQKITAITYQSDNVLYVGYDDGKIFKYDRGTWSRYDRPGAGLGMANANWGTKAIRTIALDPSKPTDIYVGVESFNSGIQVYRNTDTTGMAWDNLSGAGATQLPPMPVNSLLVDHPAKANARLFAGTDSGVYVADPATAQWARFDSALPYVEVKDLQRVGTTSQVLAATYGRGVWAVDINPGGAGLNPRHDYYGVVSDDPLIVTASGVLENDFPDDLAAAGYSATLVSGPTHGTLTYFNSDGSFQYESGPSMGEDTFQYKLSGNGLTEDYIATVFIEVCHLPALETSIGDFVWHDQNGNGVQDADEPGVDDVSVTLLDQDNLFAASTTTSGGGYYAFSGLAPGMYSVQFSYTGAQFTTQDVGDDQFDSDANSSGQTAQVEVVAGGVIDNLDAGFLLNFPPEALDDFFSTDEDTPLSVPATGVLVNDSDPDDDDLTVIDFDSESVLGAAVALDANGGFLYDPTASSMLNDLAQCQEALDSFTYTISDGNGGTATATVFISVSGTSTVFYQTGFESVVGSEWSTDRTSVTPAGNRTFLGDFANETATLTLTNLPAHTSLTLSFDLFAIRSWDGNSTDISQQYGPLGPDIFDVSIGGGQTLLHTTFSNHFDSSISSSSTRQAYPDAFPGGDHAAGTGAAEKNSLGYFHPVIATQSMDSVYRVTLTFEHTGPSLTLDFSALGLQEITDESWGLDNVQIVENGPAHTITGTITADNHYGLYVGGEDGSRLSFIGRNEVGTAGNPGTSNWSLPETYTFGASSCDHIYVLVWDDGGPQSWIGQFEMPAGAGTLFSDLTNWEYTIGSGPNPGETGQVPALGQVVADIAGATWLPLGVAAPNGTSPWGSIPGLSSQANFVWHDTFDSTSSSDNTYVIFRTKATVDSATSENTVTATLTADNHYGLYTGNGEGTALSLVGRNEVGTAGNPGTSNWSLPETYNFNVSGGDYIYLLVWDDGGPQSWIGQFVLPDGTSLFSDTSNWEFAIGSGPNPGPSGSLPGMSQVMSDIDEADWGSLAASAPNGSTPWGSIPGISLDANFVWHDTLDENSSSDGGYVIFRTAAWRLT